MENEMIKKLILGATASLILLSPIKAQNKRPMNTTKYYGSGDVNLDSKIDSLDHNLLKNKTFSDMGDIDGDGKITDNDLFILKNYIDNNAPFPSDWGKLDNRNEWLTKMLKIDKSDEYIQGWQCLNYATQLYINFRGFDKKHKYNNKHNGRFNLPVYLATIVGSDYGHTINAVLMGNNPSNFDNWIFIEPQTDKKVNIGDWDMPSNSDVYITKYLDINKGYVQHLFKFRLINGEPILLPVELISFNYTSKKNNISLEWITASETNNYGFDIERDGEKIGFVEGNGTTTKTTKYCFEDKNLMPDHYSYRLKQIDFDGSFEYSIMLEAIVENPKSIILSQNYPNPFNSTTTIEYQLTKNSDIELKLYNILGQEVKMLVKKKQNAGIHSLKFNAENLSSGMYFYRLKIDDLIQTRKMMIIK